uniref:Uncharacterized protein n=1 Tax=Cairina moschata TaxID=8855 RepID=A0A8C3C3G9_CAIMO
TSCPSSIGGSHHQLVFFCFFEIQVARDPDLSGGSVQLEELAGPLRCLGEGIPHSAVGPFVGIRGRDPNHQLLWGAVFSHADLVDLPGEDRNIVVGIQHHDPDLSRA